MKKRLVLIMILIGLLAFGIGMGTYAWFTSSVTSTNNVFKTGTLKIKNPGNGVFASGILNVNNIYPGWIGQKDITITNAGTLDFKFKLYNITLKSPDNSSDNILYSGEYGLRVSFDNKTWYKVNEIKNYEFGEITTDQGTKTITVYYKLPKAAGNDYQGKSVTLEFNFVATQTENKGWSE
ncbi:TasA family protein [Caloranaerobacter ferrireducens]|uniref:TasA family protein n=1 Tax=Caloranaerobacter ferrireducens TaxID=1323370 RepID=UPI00084D054F|nr:TasA family protein [Caloranaerobacter ferrireducens]